MQPYLPKWQCAAGKKLNNCMINNKKRFVEGTLNFSLKQR